MPFTVCFVPSFWKGSYGRMVLKFVHLVRHSIQIYPVLWLVAICSFLFFTTSFVDLHTSNPSGDEPHYLVISQTLLKYHSLDVTLDYAHQDYYVFYPGHLDPHLSRNVSGQLLPLHNIGGPVLWLIPFALFGRLGAMWFMSLVALLIILNIYKLLLSMHIRHSYAFLVSLAYAIASPLYIYSHLNFLDPALNYHNQMVGVPVNLFEVLPFAGLLGISFDQNFGLLVTFPLFIFLFVGMVLALKKKFLAYNVLILAVSIPYIILLTTFRVWSGGFGPPSRFLVVVLPLWAFYLAYALEQINNALSKLVFGGTVAYGFTYSLLTVKDSYNGFNSGLGGNSTLLYLQTLL